MAAIDYGVLVINDGKVINSDLFPTIIIGEYTVTFYKYSLTIYKNDKSVDLLIPVEKYFFYNKYSWHLNTVIGKIKVRTLSRKNRSRFITKINGYTIIFGYGIDPDKSRVYQKYVMNNYGFDKREKRIISNYLWGKENERNNYDKVIPGPIYVPFSKLEEYMVDDREKENGKSDWRRCLLKKGMHI